MGSPSVVSGGMPEVFWTFAKRNPAVGAMFSRIRIRCLEASIVHWIQENQDHSNDPMSDTGFMALVAELERWNNNLQYFLDLMDGKAVNKGHEF